MTNSIITEQLNALLSNEHNNISNMANTTAFIMQNYHRISWVGFYLYDSKQDELTLGPFQGKVACTHIKNGTGVCGTAFKQQKTIVVDNVNKFHGHIACDSNSKSEIVIPITIESTNYGVLDIDAPIFNRFNKKDSEDLESLAKVFVKHLNIDKSIK
jgi:L-methionine (R)-S-oxide reductase